MEKSAIALLPPRPSPGFYSNVFVVPKRDGGWRPIINLKRLNNYIRCSHFKMENILSLRDVLKKGDSMSKIDLKDAYMTVPMARVHQKYLRFQWQKRIYEFKSLPFGLTPAPLVFTKLLGPVVASLQQQGVRLVIYLDDLLLMAKSQDLLRQHVHLTTSLLTNLGFLLNVKKCILTPPHSDRVFGIHGKQYHPFVIRPTRKNHQDQERMSSPTKQMECRGGL